MIDSSIFLGNAFRLLSRLLVFSLCLLLFTSCGSSKTIVNGIDEKEANEIIVFLAGKGIEAIKAQSTEGTGAGGATKIVLWDIQVDASQSTVAMAYLNQAGLPRRRGQTLLGIFPGGGLVPSELQEKIRYQVGLAEQIASTIRKIDGILDAEVQISFPEDDPLHPEAKKQKITASVYVKHNGVLDDPNAHLVNKIRRLVAASVPNLDYDNVTVIGDRVRYNLPSDLTAAASEEHRQYVTIWSIILAKESATRFQIIFFSFLFLILLLLITLIWMGWKMYPVLRKHGGFKSLFHIHPFDAEEAPPTVEKAVESPIVEEKAESPQENENEEPKS